MKSYKLIEHTADIRLQVQASTLPKLFETALEGMAFIQNQQAPPQTHTITKEIFVTGSDSTELLINFLSAVLTQSHINKAIFDKLTIIRLEEKILVAHIAGYKVHSFTEDIKAVTFHEAHVCKTSDNQWQTTIVFDI